MNPKEFEELLNKITTFKKNPFHPLVWIVGKPKFGKNVDVGPVKKT